MYVGYLPHMLNRLDFASLNFYLELKFLQKIRKLEEGIESGHTCHVAVKRNYAKFWKA